MKAVHCGGFAGVAVALLAALATAGCCRGQAASSGYPADYRAIADGARREAGLVVWSSVDRGKAAGLLEDFHRGYPSVRIVYREIPARQLNELFLTAIRRHAPVPDVIWSSAMDLQIKLVNDGYALRYSSPEAPRIARWANWKDEAWGVTAEPIVFIYNRKVVADDMVPRSHDALARYLESRPSGPAGAVATYDLGTSAVGYLYFTQDQQATHGFWRLVRAMASGGARTFGSAEQVLADVAAGRSGIGYDIVGSYAVGEVARNSDLAMVLPRDYTLVVSRIAIITAAAPHPDAARLFLDHLLSRRGQRRLVAQRMSSVRSDMPPVPGLQDAGAPLRAIRVGPALLVDSDRMTRASVLRRWKAAFAASSTSRDRSASELVDAPRIPSDGR